MNEQLNKFRPPQSADIMPEVAYGTFSYAKNHSCKMWMRALPVEGNETNYKEFCASTIENLLNYGFRLCFYDKRTKIIKIDNHNLGKHNFFVVESVHGKKFMLFSCGMNQNNAEQFIGILPL